MKEVSGPFGPSCARLRTAGCRRRRAHRGDLRSRWRPTRPR